MIEFKPIEAEDKERIDPYLSHAKSRSCEMAFATIYLWRSHYQVRYAVCHNMVIFRSVYGDRESFSFPAGPEDPTKAIEALIAHCREKGIPLVMHAITKDVEKWLSRHFPGQFQVEYYRDIADYVYETQALTELRGKKYHGKKNHVNKFMKTYDWSYEKIGPDNVEECLAMLDRWKRENCSRIDEEMIAEICVSEAALRELDFLGLKGGLIRADGKVVAFTVGEQIYEDTFCVHIEKAFSDVPGAYSIINQQFLLHEAGDLPYVNREDDVGDPGLRKAKLSYHPVFMVEKGAAIYLL